LQFKIDSGTNRTSLAQVQRAVESAKLRPKASCNVKIILFGARGTIGRAVTTELTQRNEVIPVGRNYGDHRTDITDPPSIEKLLKTVGKIDGLVCATGKVHFGPLAAMTPALFGVGLQDKLMGQVNVTLAGMKYLNDGGSITLTSGILSDDFIREGSSASMVNGALEAFVRAAAIELPRGLRINIVNPNVLQEAMDAYGAYFRGFEAVSGSRVALAYSKSVEGAQTGQVYRVW
jgi:NAD(P)-dependent dehydrogenase (short-subunit alcohol dehydrogenase family)